MFLELIATFAAGFATAGVVLLINLVTRGRLLPRWVMPVAAGGAMIAYAVWSEYTWAERTIAALPEGLSVVQTIEEKKAWKPWTYLAPQVTRLVAADTGTARKNPEAPGTQLVDLYFFGRWQAVNKVPQLIDCAAMARADVTDAALADPAAASWITLEASDPLIRTVCST